MAGEKIKLSINGFGQPKISVEGGQGASCKEITASMEQALSSPGGVTITEHKPEYFETETPEHEHESSY